MLNQHWVNVFCVRLGGYRRYGINNNTSVYPLCLHPTGYRFFFTKQSYILVKYMPYITLTNFVEVIPHSNYRIIWAINEVIYKAHYSYTGNFEAIATFTRLLYICK